MTLALYNDDTYLKSCSAKITGINDVPVQFGEAL